MFAKSIIKTVYALLAIVSLKPVYDLRFLCVALRPLRVPANEYDLYRQYRKRSIRRQLW
jgi:hypothetical protein